MSAPERDGIDWRLVIGFWALIAALLLVRPLWLGDALPLQGDDMMRLVSIDQWLGGGGFQDTTIWRDNTPYGASLHWSRMVDIPIAGLIILLRPFAGAGAETIASWIWPLLLLLALMALCALLVRRLGIGGNLLPALVLPVVNVAMLAEFVPSRVDHHNIQLVLIVALALTTMASRGHAGWAWASGFLAATSLAIGMETLPFVLIAVVLHALLWAAFPERMAAPARVFALAFPLFTLAHFLIATAPARYGVVACDVVSMPYVAASLLSGAALGIAALFGHRIGAPWGRLALVTSLGILAGLVTLALYPECRFGPYGQVDPELMRRLFPAIHEALPVSTLLLEDPGYVVPVMLVPVVALAITLWRVLALRDAHRADWAILLGFLAVSVALAMVQIRGARLIAPFTVPAGMLAIGAARAGYLAHRGAGRAVLLAAAWLLFAQAVHQAASFLGAMALRDTPMGRLVAQAREETEKRIGCFEALSFGPLAALPPARLVAPIGIGSHILRFTPHSIVSAGFHRNAQGVLDNLWFHNGSEVRARAIALERNLDFVVTCPNFSEFPTAESEPTSFTSLAARGQRWDWLTPISPPDATLQILAIDKARLAAGAGGRPLLRAETPTGSSAG